MITSFKIRIVSLLCIVLSLQSCDTINYQCTPTNFTVIKDSLGEKLVRQCSRPSPRGATQFFNLTENDINTLHKNFEKIYQLKHAEEEFIPYAITDLKAYAYQYVGFVYKSTRYLYVNAFPIEFLNRQDWKRFPMVICDGGPHLWGIVFDMDTERFYNLYLNEQM